MGPEGIGGRSFFGADPSKPRLPMKLHAATAVDLESKAALGLAILDKPLVDNGTICTGAGVVLDLGFWDCILCTEQGNCWPPAWSN